MFFKIIQFLLFRESNFSSEKANLKQKNFMDEKRKKKNYLKYLQEQRIFNKSLFI